MNVNEILSNNLILIIVISALILIVLCVVFLRKGKNKSLYKKRVFLTQNEKDCFVYLKKIFPDFIVCPQVSMGAVIEPNLFKNKSQQTILRNKVQSKVIDFVILNSSDMEVAFVIELDDRSHDNKKEQDNLRDANLLNAGIVTVRFRRIKGKFPTRKEILDKL